MGSFGLGTCGAGRGRRASSPASSRNESDSFAELGQLREDEGVEASPVPGQPGYLRGPRPDGRAAVWHAAPVAAR